MVIITAVVKNLLVRVGSDTSGMRTGLQKAQKNLQDFKRDMNTQMKSVQSSMKTVVAGIGATLATIGIGAAVKSAMDVEAAMGQINRTMGASAQAFTDWANNSAMAFNMSKSDAIKFGAVYSNLISTFARDTGQTMTYTQDLLKASAVVAAGTGRSMQDSMERIRSGMLGNTEAIEDLGIFVGISMIESTKAFQRFANGRSWDQIDFQTQQQIRLFAILEQATQKYGSTIADNTMSRQQQFVAQLRNVQLGLGQAFLPIWNAVLPALTRMAAALSNVMSVVAQFTQALFGKADVANTQAQAKATTVQAGAVSGLGDAYKEAGKAASKAVAGFDEVNQLADAGAAGSGASAPAPAAPMAGMDPGLGGMATATQKVSEKVREMANKVKAAFGEMSSFIKEHKDIILAALGGLAAGFATFLLVSNWSKIVAGIRAAFWGLAAAIGAVTWEFVLVAAAVAALVGGFIYFYRTNEQFRGVVDGILKAIGDMAQWLWNDVMVPFGKWLGENMPKAWDAVGAAAKVLWDNVLKPLASWLADALPKAWDAASKAAEWLWKNVLVPLGDFLKWLWYNVLVPIGGVLEDVLGVAFQTLSDIAQSFWQNVLVPLGDFLKENFQPAIEALSAVFDVLWNDVLKPFATFMGDVLKVGFTELTDTILFLWEKVLKPLTEFVGGGMKKTFDTVFKGIGEVIGGLSTTLHGLLEFITGAFTGDWGRAWEGVKQVFKGVFDSLWGVVKAPINLIIQGVNKLIEGLNKIKIEIPAWAQKFAGGITSFGVNIPRIPELARGGIVDGATNMGNYIAGEAGKEMIVPLENTSFVDKLAGALGTAVMTAMQIGMGSNQQNKDGRDIVIQVDGSTLARVMYPHNEKERYRMDGSMGSMIVTS